jgi:23S rRNA (pseudouridine1915-N3)-methyltransferase
MQLHILATGKLKNTALRELEAEYYARLPAHFKVKITELATADTPAKEADIQTSALAKLPTTTQVILLDEHAPVITSPELSSRFELWQNSGSIAFVIGGAAGFDAVLKQKKPTHLSLGTLTFPHQFVRVMLAEQLYRAHCIITGHPYHRGNPNL